MNDRGSTPTRTPPAPERTGGATSRRGFLARSLASGGGALLLGTAGCDADRPTQEEENPSAEARASTLPAGKDPANFIVHSETPLTMETRRAALSTGGIVPYELLFVRNNLPAPPAAIIAQSGNWSVAIEGVNEPRGMTLGEMKGLGLASVAAVLQCSGNGRGFYEHEPSGSQWRTGAAGCAIWTGIPIRTIAEALGGTVSGARFVTGTGGEQLPDGVDPKQVVVERSVPLEKAMADALLAWEMNGQPLPLAHGGPLRLIVPGYYGVNQIKHVKRIAFTAAESDADIMRTGYRLRPIGEKGDPSQPTMWEMPVKSWINHPAADAPLRAGAVVIDGVAFSGGSEVRRVEISLDGGRSWQDAPFVGPSLGRFAWRQFALATTLAEGPFTLASRATDANGAVQPERRMANERGYGNTSWRDHAITLSVA